MSLFKKIFIAFCLLTLICSETVVFAFENAPLATKEVIMPMMVPFRIWVFPTPGRDGYFEFMEIAIEGHNVTILESNNPEPVIKSIPSMQK